MKIVVTGGAGFIGSALVRYLIGHTNHDVLVVDKLTYAGNLASLASVEGSPRYRFSKTDICDRAAIAGIFSSFNPDAVMNLAGKVMSIGRSMGRRISSTPILSAHTNCWKVHCRIGRSSTATARSDSAFIISRRMKYLAR